MSEDRKRQKPSQSAYVVAAAVAALAGFATIYWSLRPPGNDSLAVSTGGETPGAGEETAPAAGKGQLAGLNRGEMAAFVIRPEPRSLPKLTIETGTGETKSMAEFEGKVVLLNLWATWCHPCREEMPGLAALQQELGGDDFQVVAISIDRGDAEKPKAFLAEIGAESLPFYRDPSGKLFAELGTIGMPTTLLIDRQGRDLGRLVGPAEWNSEDAKRLIRAAIDATPQSSARAE